jgi:hypothetical protein
MELPRQRHGGRKPLPLASISAVNPVTGAGSYFDLRAEQIVSYDTATDSLYYLPFTGLDGCNRPRWITSNAGAMVKTISRLTSTNGPKGPQEEFHLLRWVLTQLDRDSLPDSPLAAAPCVNSLKDLGPIVGPEYVNIPTRTLQSFGQN